MSHKFYKPTRSRLQRSELAVPGSSPKMFEKALNSAADYVFLDLEDAVSPNDKITARANVIKSLSKAKVLEEINELIEAVEEDTNKIHEAADVFYHLAMYLEANNIKIEDVMSELDKRKK